MSENVTVVFGPSDGTSLRDVMMGIRSKRGVLSREVIVEEASDPKHPLHHRFEWNDAIAGHKYRLAQAGALLRVTYKADVGDERVDLRAFVRPQREDGVTGVYEPLEEVIADPITRKIMLNQMRRDWNTFRRRYEHMAEFVEEVLAGLVEVEVETDDTKPEAG